MFMVRSHQGSQLAIGRRAVGVSGGTSARHVHRYGHHVGVEIGDDPNRAGDDEKDDQHAEGKGQNIVRVIGPAAQMQKEDEVDADLREGPAPFATIPANSVTSMNRKAAPSANVKMAKTRNSVGCPRSADSTPTPHV